MKFWTLEVQKKIYKELAEVIWFMFGIIVGFTFTCILNAIILHNVLIHLEINGALTYN